MSHIFNPIFKRVRDSRWVDNPQGIGRHVDFYRYFVSCSCGWYGWYETEQDGQDAWIEHFSKEPV